MKCQGRKDFCERNQNIGCLWVQSVTEKGHREILGMTGMFYSFTVMGLKKCRRFS